MHYFTLLVQILIHIFGRVEPSEALLPILAVNLLHPKGNDTLVVSRGHILPVKIDGRTPGRTGIVAVHDRDIPYAGRPQPNPALD